MMASFDHDYEIVSIVEACRCMASDKITERRKNAENLQKLLGNQAYVDHLDTNSDSSSGFTWDDIFKAACNYMRKVHSYYLLSNFLDASTNAHLFLIAGSRKIQTR